MRVPKISRPALSWALYDWANSAFVLSVITVFYGGVFENYWYAGPGDAFFWLGVSVTVSSLLLAVAAPLLGSIADQGPVKKRGLLVFASLGSAATAGLALVPQGAWEVALGLRFVASLGFFGSLVFYDALLTEVSTKENRHVVSGLGFSIGYLGSVLLLLVQYAVLLDPPRFGLSGPLAATRVAFLSVALWWVVFSWPLLRYVPETDARPRPTIARALRESGRQLRANVRLLLARRAAFLFLLAYFCYIDGVNTFMQMVAGFTARVGVPQVELIQTIILVQIVGVPCAVLLGWLGQRFRPGPFIFGSVVVYLGVTLSASRFTGGEIIVGGWAIKEIYLLGLLIGTVQGGLQALSRSYYANLIPAGHAAAFFGFYNMLGKGGAIAGPLLMGSVGWAAGDARWGALAVAVLFLGGLVLFHRASKAAGAKAR